MRPLHLYVYVWVVGVAGVFLGDVLGASIYHTYIFPPST